MTLNGNWIFAAAFLGGVGHAVAGSFTLVPEVPGSDPLSTGAQAINDAGTIGGYYTTGGGAVTSAFIGNPGGTYTTFNYQAAGFTTVYTDVRNINNAGTAVGIGQDAAGNIQGYQRSANGTITTLINPATGLPLDWVAGGINQAGTIVGSYTSGSSLFGYILSADGSSLTTLADPLAFNGRTHGQGINDNGQVVGFYNAAPGLFAGFIYDIASGTYTTLNDPLGVNGTTLSGINDSGFISGSFLDANNNFHGFVYDPATSAFTTLNVPGATQTSAGKINASGQIAISSDVGAYIYSPVPDVASRSLLSIGLVAVSLTLRRRSTRAVGA